MSVPLPRLPYDLSEQRCWQYEMLLLEQVIKAIREHGGEVALAKLAAAPSLSMIPPRRHARVSNPG
jgi:hypothetical protein